MIVRLPPKQLMLDAFLEERRSKLQRWLFLISQHPILSKDEMLRIFLTERSESHQEMINNVTVESSFNNLKKFDLCVIKEKEGNVKKLLNQILKIKRLIMQHFKYQKDIAEDYQSMASSLSAINEEISDSSLKDFSENYDKIYKEQLSRKNQESSVVERIDLIIEIFTAFCDLIERTEESLQSEKTPTLNQRLQSAIKGNHPEISDPEAREERISLAIYYILEEYKFALKYLKLLQSIMLKFTHDCSLVFANISKTLSEIIEIESEKLNL